MIRKLVLALFVICATSFSYADINGDGYYRVRNYGSKRWATLVDNQGSVDMISAQADLHALKLTKNTEEIMSDPGSIVYISNISGKNYKLSAQGTGLGNLMDREVFIGENGKGSDGQKLYRIYGVESNVTRYICDSQTRSVEIGLAAINEIPYNDYKSWEFIPVDVTDNYIGVVPEITIDGKSYCSFFSSFPFKAYSPGVKTYYISRTTNGMAEMVEISDVVPGGIPVVIECAGPNASDNKLQISSNSGSISDSSLRGVYFNYSGSQYVNRTAYDSQTMRVLGRCADGSLGFVKSDIDFIPHNTAYLPVETNWEDDMPCVSSDIFTAGVDSIEVDFNELTFDGKTVFSTVGSEIRIINMAGQTVASAVGYLDITSLPKGVYVAVSGNKSIKILH